jgi:hypothetical protein
MEIDVSRGGRQLVQSEAARSGGEQYGCLSRGVVIEVAADTLCHKRHTERYPAHVVVLELFPLT